jgi:hypothetical protein
MIVIALSLMVAIILGNVTSISSNSFQKTSDVGYAINKTKVAFEKFVKDVNNADMMLCQYPVNGTPIYTSADDDTIILRQPMFDTNNDPIDNQFNVVVYRLVSTIVPADGPMILKKYTSTIVGGTENSLTYQGIVAKNIKAGTIQTAVDQQYWGDYSTTDFYLYTTPDVATAQIPTAFLVGGVDRLADGKAVLAGNKITTFKAMNSGVRADAVYHIDPSYKVDSTGFNGGTSLFVKFTIAPSWKSVGLVTKSRDFVFSSQPALLNSTTNL